MAMGYTKSCDNWGWSLPPVSKKQARLMRAAAAGDIKLKGLSKKEAKEYVEGHKTKHLPEKKKK